MIAIIGKSGQLARKCAELLGNEQAICLGKHDIDITSDSALNVLDSIKVTAIINASAYTAVDKAESEKTFALSLNEGAVKRLSKYAAANSIHFVHVSTDYVFKGDKGSPYLPTDEYEPVNVYGETKMLGEQAVLTSAPYNSCVLRTSWVYSEFGSNFVAAMLNLMEQKEELGVIYDQVGTPTSVDTLARACIAASKQQLQGIHHITDEGVASWYDFAICIQKLAFANGMLSKKIPIIPLTTAQYPTPSARPHYSVLSKQSLKHAIPELHIPYWQDALEIVLLNIKNT